MGALLNVPLGDRLGLGKVNFYSTLFFFPHKTQNNGYSSDARGRTSLPDCGVSDPISCTSYDSTILSLLLWDLNYQDYQSNSSKLCRMWSRSVTGSHGRWLRLWIRYLYTTWTKCKYSNPIFKLKLLCTNNGTGIWQDPILGSLEHTGHLNSLQDPLGSLFKWKQKFEWTKIIYSDNLHVPGIQDDFLQHLETFLYKNRVGDPSPSWCSPSFQRIIQSV